METKEIFELTNPQKNIWNTELFFSNTNVNNVCVSGIINEVVNFDILKKAINILVEKNDSFRINLLISENIPMQTFSAFAPFDIDIINVNSKSEFTSIEQSMVNEKFTLINSNLFKFKLAKFPDGKGGIILNVHHIIADSWSLGLTIQEIVKIYHCLLNNNSEYISDTFSYKNLITAEQDYKNSNRYNNDKEFWNSYLKNFSEPVSIPSINKENYEDSSKAKRLSFNIDVNLVKQISEFCNTNKISNYAFFMSVFSLYIANVSNVNDLIIGTPILNRLNYKDKLTTGMFVTTKPFRVRFNMEDTFANFALTNNINLVSLLRHQRYSYSDILEDIRQTTNIPNLYNISMSYQITKAVSSDIGDYETNWTFNNNCLNDINIHLYDINDTGNLQINYDFLIEKYSEDEINSMHLRILNMINQILLVPSILLSNIQIVTPEEQNQMFNVFNNRTLSCPLDKNIIKLFEEQVNLHPNDIALKYKDEKYTYTELNCLVNKFARLLKEYNVEKNDIVGIYMNKNSWFIICILAIQKLGAAYLPMHPDYPEDRVNYILKDSNSKLLITDQTINTDIPLIIEPENQNLTNYGDSNLNIDFSSDTLCYVIYTSGSTGNPKGVMLSHYNLINFIYNFNDCFKHKFSSDDICLSVTNISFDVSVCEIYTPLLFGASLVIYPRNTLTDIHILCDILESEHITFLYIPPSVLLDVYKFIKLNNYSFNVNKMLVGVESIKNSTLNKLLTLNENLEIVNGYGPTETTICITFYTYSYNANESEIVPIGFPLKNNDVFILNRFDNLQPVGYPGELCVSGKNVSFGYINNQEVTKKSFVNISKYNNKLFYKTGDIAYWSDAGYINFIGRQDSQIKFRGHRIELNEINKKLKNIDGVDNSITLFKKVNKIPSICCYVSLSDNSITVDYIKESLEKTLPYYMIPNHIIILEVMPITKNGKIDKNSLPEIEVYSSEIKEPSSLTEIKLHQILCKLLHLDKISINDDLFDLGMDSLICIRLSLEIFNVFNKNVTIKDLFRHTTIYDLSNYIDTCDNTNNADDIPIAPNTYSYPLSSAQKRIYYATKLSGNNSLLYNISGGLLINSHLDKDKVESVFNEIIKRNSSFRTYFKIENNEPRQFILDSYELNLKTIIDKEISKKDIPSLIDNFPKAFDLKFAPLLRVELHYIEDSSLILIDSHHIILDGTSLDILLHDFCTLYNEDILPNKEIEYKDFSVWESKLLDDDSMILRKDYWNNRFKNYEIPVINLPYDFPVGDKKTFNGNKIYYKIDEDLLNKIFALSKKLNVSDYMIFLTNLYLMLYKYTGQNNIIIGSPIEARNSIKLSNLIGMFVNNIALNLKIDDNETLENLVLDVKDLVLSSLENQPYPYDLLLKDLQIPSNTSLFDIVFTYQNNEKNNYNIGENKLELLPANTHTSKFNLTFEVVPSTCTLAIEYNTDLFKIDTINSFFEHFVFLLNNFTDNLLLELSSINIITEKENDLLSNFNNTDDIINDDTVVSIFENQVKSKPNDIALICDDKKLTYLELNQKANSLAHLLINSGIHQNDIVCVMTNRSLETIVCMLGILKAGAAFLNVDPTYPIERTQYYLADCKAQYVLTQKCLKDSVKEIQNCIEIDLDNDFYNENFDNPNVKVNANDLSYVIYTSGSTGKPKGVMLNQIGFANMTKAMSKVLDYLKEGNKHCLVSVTSTPFDIFVYEIIVSLTHGLKVLMANNAEHRNPILLDALIKKYDADVMTVTPSLMKINYDNRLEPSALSNIKHMVFGGEPLPEKFVQDLRDLSDGVTIYNIYGPSEITILCNVQNLNGEDKISIGPPIMNTQIHILDKNGHRVPIGVVGEIYISGIQVGLGYLGKPEMTKEKFLPNNFGSGNMYKSGDIGRWTFDGKVQCLGRIDHQIKLRGLRIELGEIEQKMESIDGVISSVVNKFEHNGKEFLCGYYVTDKDSDISEQFVKDFLRKSLPYYMVPTYIVRLDQMPYTINRKIDRKALPLPDFENYKNKDKISNETISPREELLLNIWKKILNINVISINDNFFDIGGDSISAINMQLEAMKNGFNFEYADIFNFPTIKFLANKNQAIQENVVNLGEYDYSKINQILAKNNVSNINSIKKFDVNNILLIGGTGYLGAHLIYEFLTKETGDIYCLVRTKNNVIPSERLKNTLNFYFGNNFYEENINRIHIVEGDIVKENLGLSPVDFNLIEKNISAVINSGAIVKHFGQKDLFEKINITGTANVVDLCKKLNKRLLHISTISISGNGEKENTIQETIENINLKTHFSEQNLYVGQNLNGIYTRTKFEAEKIILNEVLNGLDAQILRIGNIVNRYSDGKFQINTSENAFAQRIKSFIEIGAFPEYALYHAIDLTPVDLCAEAIIKILNYNSCCTVLHVYNTNLLPIKLFYDTLNDMSINLIPVSEEKMTNIIEALLDDPEKKNILSGIIQDLDANKHLVYTSNIKLETAFTEEYLKHIGFSWQYLDKNYIMKYINYFKEIKFLD